MPIPGATAVKCFDSHPCLHTHQLSLGREWGLKEEALSTPGLKQSRDSSRMENGQGTAIGTTMEVTMGRGGGGYS